MSIIAFNFTKISAEKKEAKNFLIFILCFGWSPKAVYHESFGTFPTLCRLCKS